jgi:hypothetical protein
MMDVRKKLFIYLTIIFLVFGAITAPWEGHQKWVWRGMFLYFLPMFCMFFRSQKIQETGIIIGVALVLQTLISPVFFNYFQDVDLITIEPNFSKTLTIPAGIYPGVEGPQLTKTDHKGYRITKPISYTNKPNGSFRIFTLGGSTTAGFPWVGIRNNWPHLLQEKLDQNLSHVDVEVINAGVTATRAKHHLATLKKILPYSPDMVIFLIGINDWDRHIKVAQDNKGVMSSFIRYDEVEQQFLIRGIDTKYSMAFWNFREAIRFDHTILAETIKLIKKRLRSNEKKATSCPQENPNCFDSVADESHLTNQTGGLARTDKRTFRPQKVSSYYTYYLKKIRDVCQSNKIDCIFVTQPTAYHHQAKKEIKERLWMVPGNRDYTLDFDSLIHISELYNNYLIGFAKENDFPSCDLASQIEPSIGNLVDDCHFNLQGAKNVASFLFSCINELSRNSSKNPGLKNFKISRLDPSAFSRNETVLSN